MNHASGAVAPEDAEVVQVSEAIWQQAERPANTAPASSRPRYLLMSIQLSGCVIIDKITLRFIVLAVDKAKGDPVAMTAP